MCVCVCVSGRMQNRGRATHKEVEDKRELTWKFEEARVAHLDVLEHSLAKFGVVVHL